ncbi:MAG: leucine-rich repeat domain-containing protein [Prevotella sp.]|nr:leucine-rich repeat domain-containing protein [Prevotella sp.]
MKKAKLFMMFALLVMGVSNVWAGEVSESYDVTYVGLPDGVSGSYTINREYDRGLTTLGTTEGINVQTSNPNLIVMSNYAALYNPDPTNLTNSNYNTYFRPTTITGYDASVNIDAVPNGNNHGRITITYTINLDNVEIGDYIYSTKYWQSGQSSNTINMPPGEIAIALNPKYTDNITNEPYRTGNSISYRSRNGVQTSHVVNAVIPATVEIGGQTFRVTAIQKLGFTYAQNYVDELYNCGRRINNPRSEEQKEQDGIYGSQVYDQDSRTDVSYATLNDHSNWYLESVTFEAPENIKWIGDYAFQSCTKLKSIVIPKNVEYLGTGVCSTCPILENVSFQVDESTRRSKVSLLRKGSFFRCKSIKSLELPEGLVQIEGSGSDDGHGGTNHFAPLQYMTGLILIRLPNTLTTIGSHFLCCASSLHEITIPASVTSFDGAAFHGCEALESVYLLGPAAALNAGTGGSQTFGENSTLCEEHVSGCTFYTTPDYLNSYANHAVWSTIDEDGKDDGSTRTNSAGRTVTSNYANTLKAIEEEKRTFPGGKWVTAIFPNGVTNYKSVFGNATRVARPSGTPTHTFEQGYRMYNVTFQLISGNNIPAGTPVMFCPENTVENYPMITIENMADPDFKLHMTDEHLVDPLTADDGALIDMKGQYKDHVLFPMDFYFMYKDKTVDANGNTTYTNDDERAKFYRVTDSSIRVNIRSTRCYWSVNVNGVKTSAQMAPAKSARFFFDDETTGINNVETKIALEGIYDLNGRKLDVNPEDLPQGLFIINGKKVIKK